MSVVEHPGDVRPPSLQLLPCQIVFHPNTEVPKHGARNLPYLLWNQCDGFHVVEAWFDDDGTFVGFNEWARTPGELGPDFYSAWAELPDHTVLDPNFRKPPDQSR